MRVNNMASGRSGREVANQFIITDGNRVVFQSYNSVICIVDFDKQGAERVTLGRDWDYSNTTRKYLYQFLYEVLGWNANGKAIETAIKNKDITYNEDLV